MSESQSVCSPIPLSAAQATVVRHLWLRGWSAVEIARYLGVSPWRVDTGHAEAAA